MDPVAKSSDGGMKRLFFFLTALICITSMQAEGRVTNPYPTAVLRQGDVYLLKGKDNWQRLTHWGDVQWLCWMSTDTLCFERKRTTGLKDSADWRGFEVVRDLFMATRDGKILGQFTADHFTEEPSPSPMRARALFAHRPDWLTQEYEIWETIRPNIRNRPLGIRGHMPDASANQRWTAAALNGEGPSGVGLYRYPTNDSYRKIEGPHTRPRFSPNNVWYAFLSYPSDPDSCGIYAYEIPDGDVKFILRTPEGFVRICDFGWSRDGFAFILVLEDAAGKRDAFFYDMELKSLQRLSDTGDIDQASTWH